jgi:hypothetical protein
MCPIQNTLFYELIYIRFLRSCHVFSSVSSKFLHRLLAQDHRKPIKHVMKTAVNKFATLATLQLLQLLHSTLLSFGPLFTIFKGFAAFVQSLQA